MPFGEAGSSRRFLHAIRNQPPHAALIKDEFRDGPRNVDIAHERQGPIIEDQPLMIYSDRQDGVILVRQPVPPHDNLQRLLRESRLEQRGVFEDCIVLAVAAFGQKRLERIAPAIGNAPLPLVAHRFDRKIHRPIDQADLRASISTGAFTAQIDQLLRRRGTGMVGPALRDGLAIPAYIGLNPVPLLVQSATEHRLRIHAKGFSGIFIARCRSVPVNSRTETVCSQEAEDGELMRQPRPFKHRTRQHETQSEAEENGPPGASSEIGRAAILQSPRQDDYVLGGSVGKASSLGFPAISSDGNTLS
ncbi:MAG TPA: hypothetical protein VFL62_23810 [Bradyrhizobium sp.]|nr:hypothetical protein [Bradyrhizobium sp.]